MIHWPHYKHNINARICSFHIASVPDLYFREGCIRLCQRGLPRQFYMQGSCIDEVYFIPPFREPEGVDSRTTADVEYDSRRLRDVACDDFLSANQFNLT